MERINVGIIGAGRIGRLHAEHLTHRIPRARVLAIADLIAEAAQRCAAQFHVPKAPAHYEEILNDPEIRAVFICSSTDTHADLIAEAAQAGKHIFCEKPIALDLAAIDGALASVAKAGVKLQIGFNRRFDANFRRIRERVQAGDIGRPHILRITSRDPAPPPIEYVKVSGGIFLDMMIHDFDMARYLTGSEVEEISVAAGALVDPAIGEAGDVDTAVTTLRFANGAIGTIDNSRRAVYGYDQRVEAFGSGGMVQADNKAEDQRVLWSIGGVQRATPPHFFLERYSESFVSEMRAFARSILDDTTPPVTGRDGRIPMLMAMAAKKSHRERRPVRLCEVEG